MYDWLVGLENIESEIAYAEWKLEKNKEELERWCDPEDLGQYRLTRLSKGARIEEFIQRNERELAFKMNLKYDLVKIIYTFKGLDQEIMRMKHVEGKSLKEIASELGYDYQHIRRRHSKILKTDDK